MNFKGIVGYQTRDEIESPGKTYEIEEGNESSDSNEEESYVAIHIKQPFKIMYTDNEGNMFTVDPVNIPDNAYMYRSNVTELYFPVTEAVGNNAFKGCTLAKTLYIPKLTYAGENAFNGCLVLEKIDAPVLETICDGAFQACASANPINIPKAKLIGNNSFQDCMAVEDICIPFVTSIGDYSFRGCDNLRSFRALSLMISGKGAFAECQTLAGIFVPGVYELKDETFKGCGNLRYVSFPKADTIYEETFAECSNALYINLPNVLASGLARGAFTGLDKLRWLDISREVTKSMLTDAYLKDLGIETWKCNVNVICKDGIKYSENQTKDKNERLEYSVGGIVVGIKKAAQPQVQVQDGNENSDKNSDDLDPNLDDFYATGIAPSVFKDRTELQSVVMLNLTGTIQAEAFAGCSELMFAAFPKLSAPTIAAGAFKDCPKLLNVCLIGMSTSTVWNSGGEWGLPSGCVIECSNGYVVIP